MNNNSSVEIIVMFIFYVFWVRAMSALMFGDIKIQNIKQLKEGIILSEEMKADLLRTRDSLKVFDGASWSNLEEVLK